MKLLLRVGLALTSLSFIFPFISHASYMSNMSDQISWSVPDATSTTHRIRFQASNPIPPGGKILLYQDDGALQIPASLSYLDIDLAVGALPTGPYVDRTLAATDSATDDGVTIVPGGTPGVSAITFTLNSTTGIAAGEFVEIRIGANATFDAVGTEHLTNPSGIGSYRIRVRTKDPGGTTIDDGAVMYAIVAPVTLGPIDTTDVYPPVRSNGLPFGTLPASTAKVEFSVNTDKYSTCHYDTIPGTAYLAQPFIFAKTNNTLHTKVISVAQGTAYAFYVRCSGVALGAATNTDDYLISFDIGTVSTSTATSTTPAPPPPPPPPPPTPAGASGPGGGNFLGKADVTFLGSAFPLAPVTLLKDNKIEWEFAADVSGHLETTRYGYERGPQSFSMYAADPKGRKTSTYTGTIYLIANTNNLVGPIFLSPTLGLVASQVEPGETVHIEGSAIPQYPVEIFMQKQGGASGESNIVHVFATSSLGGTWKADLSTTGLGKGTYEIKARTIVSERDQSIYSPYVYVGVGESPSPDFKLRADLNKDGKVNLVDFSILLFNWKTGDAVADINQDGEVNLTDFSIMVFYWTG